MLFDILRHTPAWVWLLLAALVALGLQQMRTRVVPTARLAVLPLVMAALSAAGAAGAFGLRPTVAIVWLAGVAAAFALGRRAVAVIGAVPVAPGRLQVPGSPVPLTLILALFAVKYAVGVTLAMHPGLASDPSFALPGALAYGGFAGLFLARAASLRAVRPRIAA